MVTTNLESKPAKPLIEPIDPIRYRQAVANGKQTFASENSKAAAARVIYQALHDEPRDVILRAFIEGASITPTRRHANPFNQFVFNDKKGLARNNVHLTFKKAFERAGITGCTAHTLRHTHATRLIQNGLNLYEVKEILGHADIQTTMRYAHIEQAKVSLKARDVINQINLDQDSKANP